MQEAPLAGNSRRKFKKLKVTAAEAFRALTEVNALLSSLGRPASSPDQIVVNLRAILGSSDPLAAMASSAIYVPPQFHRSEPPDPGGYEVSAEAGPGEMGADAGMTLEEMERIRESKLQRAMSVASTYAIDPRTEQRVRVPAAGSRGAPSSRGLLPGEGSEPVPAGHNHPMLAEQPEFEMEFEEGEEYEEEQVGGGPVNPQTGVGLEEARNIIARVTGREIKAPTPGGPNLLKNQ